MSSLNLFWVSVSFIVVITAAVLYKLWKVLNKDDDDDEILGI
jgi:hypothetical protein